METLPIPRTTIIALVNAFNEAEAKIRCGFKTLEEAEAGLTQAFGEKWHQFDLAYLIRQHRLDFKDPGLLLDHLKRNAWYVLAERMELRRIFSQQRAQELDEQLESGKGLPPITEQDILAVLEGTLASLTTYREEAVKEVFEFLRPHCSRHKTNTELEIGKRVILSWAVERKYGADGFHINHHTEQHLRSVDNVFHALDGKGLIPTYGGPLCDAIKSAGRDGCGETEYFRFRCFANRNLHLEFKRLDLVAKLNAVAGGNRLKPET